MKRLIENPRETRKKLGLNQENFWGRIEVTQPGGSRYESGRDIPEPTAILLDLAYGSPVAALRKLAELRGVSAEELVSKLTKEKPANEQV